MIAVGEQGENKYKGRGWVMNCEVDRKFLTTILFVVSDKLGWYFEGEPPDHTFGICNC